MFGFVHQNLWIFFLNIDPELVKLCFGTGWGNLVLYW